MSAHDWQVGDVAVIEGFTGRRRLVVIERVTPSRQVVTSDGSRWLADGRPYGGGRTDLTRLRHVREIWDRAEHSLARGLAQIGEYCESVDAAAEALQMAAVARDVAAMSAAVTQINDLMHGVRRLQQCISDDRQILADIETQGWQP